MIRNTLTHWIAGLFGKRAVQITSTKGAIDAELKEILGATRSGSGPVVTAEAILGNPYLKNAVETLSSLVATTPLNVIKEGPDGRQVDWRHQGQKWLDRPTADDSIIPMTLIQTVTAHAIIFGNGYIYLFRDPVTGYPVDCVILDPQMTAPGTENGRKIYTTSIGGEARILLPENVVHIKGLSVLTNGQQGESLLDIARGALGLSLAVQRYSELFFRNGAHSRLAIEVPKSIKADRIIPFRDSFNSIHRGLENSHKVILLEEGSKIQQLQADNDSLQLVELMEQLGKEISNLVGIPPAVLGIASGYTSFNSLEQEDKRLLKQYLNKWLKQWEQQLTVKILTEKQITSGSHFVEFNRAALTETDQKAEIELLTMQLDYNILAWEEVRNIRNLSTDFDGLTFIGQKTANPNPPPAPEPLALPAPTDPQEEDPVEEDPQEPASEDPSERSTEIAELRAEMIEQLQQMKELLEQRSQVQTELAKIEQEVIPAVQDASRAILDALTNRTVERLLNRVRKAVEADNTDLEKHRSVFVKELDAYASAEAVTDAFLTELRDELAAISTADRNRIGWDRYKTQILKGLA